MGKKDGAYPINCGMEYPVLPFPRHEFVEKTVQSDGEWTTYLEHASGLKVLTDYGRVAPPYYIFEKAQRFRNKRSK